MGGIYTILLVFVYRLATGGIPLWMAGVIALLQFVAGWIACRNRQRKWKQGVERQLGELTAQIRLLQQERESLVRQRQESPEHPVLPEAAALVPHVPAGPAARETAGCATPPPQVAAKPGIDPLLLKRALEIVNEYYKDPGFGVEEFSQIIATDKDLVSNHKHQAARKFIRTFRLNAAYELILKNRVSRSMNIAEIAYEVGFNDPKYFTRCFTRHFGLSPKEVLLGKDTTCTDELHPARSHAV